MGGLRNDHNALLVQETETDLCVVLSVPASNLPQHRIAEEAVLSAGERRPGFVNGLSPASVANSPEYLILPYNIVFLFYHLPSGFQNPLDCLGRIQSVVRKK